MPPGQSPAFSFYAKDFMLSTVTMSLAERGAYITLIAYQWDRGSVPNDPVELQRIFGCTRIQAGKLWDALGAKFQQGEDGLYRNARLELERAKQEQWRSAQAARGRRAAAGRWNPDKPKAMHTHSASIEQAKPEDMPKNAFPLPSPSPGTSPLKNAGKSRAPARDAPPPKTAFDGSRLRVWRWQHEELIRRLGAKAAEFDLLGWYERLDAELELSGESYADPWKWLQERLYADADLPLPNLFGRQKTSGNTAAGMRWLQKQGPR